MLLGRAACLERPAISMFSGLRFLFSRIQPVPPASSFLIMAMVFLSRYFQGAKAVSARRIFAPLQTSNTGVMGAVLLIGALALGGIDITHYLIMMVLKPIEQGMD